MEKQLVLRITNSEKKIVDLYSKFKKLLEAFSIIKPYKVFTALLTQNGDNNAGVLTGSDLTIGVTYQIKTGSIGTFDFTNVGAPNNDIGTFFVATGTTPNDWSGASLNYNLGAPVVTVLENTIGNIWFTYDGVGNYGISSNNLFTSNKTASFISSLDGASGLGGGSPLGSPTSINNLNDTLLGFVTVDSTGAYSDNLIDGYPIEIRVYN